MRTSRFSNFFRIICEGERTRAFLLLFFLAFAQPHVLAQTNANFGTVAMKSEELAAARVRLDRFVHNLSDTLHAEIAVAFRDLDSRVEYARNDTVTMHAASTMKVPVMIEVFRQAEQGKFRLHDSLLVKNEFASIVDGSPYGLDLGDDSDEAIYKMIGRRRTIQQLVEAMITVSSNLATNILIELVGAESVMKTLHELGITGMHVLRGVEDGKAYRAGLNNRTNAHALLLIMAAIAENRAASTASCRAMLDILKAQKFRESIPAGLPAEILVANKTGSITAINHDAAILFPPQGGPCVLVVLTRGFSSHERAQQAIAAVAQNVYQELVRREMPDTAAK